MSAKGVFVQVLEVVNNIFLLPCPFSCPWILMDRQAKRISACQLMLKHAKMIIRSVNRITGFRNLLVDRNHTVWAAYKK